MPIICAADALKDGAAGGPLGTYEALLFSDSGGLTQFGAFVETLYPGAQSSELHWHEKEDEFVYMLSGTVMLREGDADMQIDTPLFSGDAATFKAGQPLGHCLINLSDAPAAYLVVGTRTTNDHWHYPLKDEHVERDGKKRVVRNSKGEVVREYDK
jgi:uncharacterized cupin superfamily protein